LTVLVLAAPAMAQPGHCTPCATRSDSAFFIAHDANGSLAIALEGLARDSNDVAMLVRASRAELVLGIVKEERNVIDGHLAKATTYARRAVALAPNDADTHFWLAAALGRRALRAGFRAGASLASETYKEGSKALALDSMNAGAHDVIGKLHSETRKLSWIVRRLAATLTGLEIARTASWEKAEWHLKRSIALDSTLMMARVDLSQLYLRTGRRAEAVAIVEQLEKMPARTPADAWFQGEARKRLGWYP
jgi:tetratricopeptide (TPR) repeat protein